MTALKLCLQILRFCPPPTVCLLQGKVTFFSLHSCVCPRQSGSHLFPTGSLMQSQSRLLCISKENKLTCLSHPWCHLALQPLISWAPETQEEPSLLPLPLIQPVFHFVQCPPFQETSVPQPGAPSLTHHRQFLRHECEMLQLLFTCVRLYLSLQTTCMRFLEWSNNSTGIWFVETWQ